MAIIIKSTTKKNGNDKCIFGHIVDIGGGLHYPSSAIRLLTSGSTPDSSSGGSLSNYSTLIPHEMIKNLHKSLHLPNS